MRQNVILSYLLSGTPHTHTLMTTSIESVQGHPDTTPPSFPSERFFPGHSPNCQEHLKFSFTLPAVLWTHFFHPVEDAASFCPLT